ncbi:MAG: tetratricopeptide repeat protein, partial [Anaerolineales bacterium]
IDTNPIIRYKAVMNKKIILVMLLSLLGLSCSLSGLLHDNNNGQPPVLFAPEETPTPTETPLPTATATPEPAERIEAGERAMFEGDYARALQEFELVRSASPDANIRAAALLGIGRAHYESGNCTASIQILTELLNTYPDSYWIANAQFFLGECYRTQQRWSEAAQAYAAYLHLRPGFLDAYVQELRGDALAAAGSFSDAIQAYQAAAEAPQLTDPVNTHIKIAKTYAAMGDHENAIRKLLAIYEATSNDYVKATVNLLAGQSYLAMGLPEQAYARFQDSVDNFPRSYDSYSALVALVENGIPVNELNRGLVDYFAGQYAVAIEAFNRYLKNDPQHDGTAHHYKALSLRAIGDFEAAIAEWDALIADHAGDRFYAAAYDEKAYTLWAHLNQHARAAETLRDFVGANPSDPEAPNMLYEAARIYERNNQLLEAAALWERLMNEYPSAELSYRGLFLAGVSYYRLGNFDQALLVFQRALVLASSGEDQSAALFWIGKTQQAKGDAAAAQSSWEQAVQRDPTGYYSERAREVLNSLPPLTAAPQYELNYDLKQERYLAELWLRNHFSLAPETDLAGLGPLANDLRIRRGNAFYELGLYSQASAEFEAVRQDVQQDAVNTFRLLNHLLDLGFYRSAILASRQILNLAQLSDVDTFTAPDYFNHIRFGTYYKNLIVPVAQSENFHPLFLYAVIRQESMFEGHVRSSAGARGLMQIMPATGQELASELNWPPNFTPSDLYRPVVSITLGARYLARQRDYFGGDLYAALAAYNGGPGNASIWKALSGGDPDLFLEVIRIAETRTYIMQVAEFMNIYRRLYERSP